MVDSDLVLLGQTLAYTFYALAIIAVVGWFGYSVTREGNSRVSSKLFYSFTAMLIVLGLSLHVVTYNTLPWVASDFHRDSAEPAQVFDIVVADHEFTLPADELVIQCGTEVLFDVTSEDLTYGFGLFREDNSMVTQMQVVPGHRNDLLWKFEEEATYTIRSTEYSGPAGIAMIIPDAVRVVGCEGE